MAYINREKAIAYVEEQYRLFKGDESKRAIVEGCVEALKFTPIANVVELPCKTVYYIFDKHGLAPMVFSKPIEYLHLYEVMNLEHYGYYKSQEEAEVALKEREKNVKTQTL